MSKIEQEKKDLANMQAAIREAWNEQLHDNDRVKITDGLNKIFNTNLKIDDDLSQYHAWDYLNISPRQTNALQAFVEELQDQYVISPEDPCEYCGHYFAPEEDILYDGDERMCTDCFNKTYKTQRERDYYFIIANAGGDVDALDPWNESPETEILDHLDDKTVAKLAEDFVQNENACVFMTTAAEA